MCEFETKVGIVDADYIIYKYSNVNEPFNLFTYEVICNNIVNYLDELKQRIDCNKILLLFTVSNFRRKLNVEEFENEVNFKLYKNNRLSVQNEWFKPIKNFLYSLPNAYYIPELEADDSIAIIANKLKQDNIAYVIVSPDKDLRIVEEVIYNPNTSIYLIPNDELHLNKRVTPSGKPKLSIEAFGLKYLYCQMIMGDSADNILGIKGKGVNYAYNLFKDCDVTQMVEKTKYLYSVTYNDWERVYDYNLTLLYILKYIDCDLSIIDYELL